MLTREQVLAAVTGGRNSECLDGRDYSRLLEFFPVADWTKFGFEAKPGVDVNTAPKEWTRETILDQLGKDVAFGFEKALNQRGISSGLMYNVVKMWMWVLEDEELANFNSYAQYGLPLFKAVAVKYGFPNEIGDDNGDESRYSDSGY